MKNAKSNWKNTTWKRTAALLLVMVMALSLAACGGATIPEEYLGTYISMAAEAYGMTLTGDDISGWDITLEQGGKGTLHVEGESGSIKYTIENGTITLKVSGEKIVGTISNNVIKIDDMLGTGMNLTFGKEGTDAANPENYLPAEEKAMLGTWTSYAVEDVLGDDASDETDPDGLTLEIRGDHTVTVTKDGEEITSEVWSCYSSTVYLDADISWELDNGELVVDYYVGDDYFTFYCEK